MSDSNGSTTGTSTGALVVAFGVMILLCGGVLAALLGGGFLWYRWELARQDEQRQMMGQIAERPLPPGAHAIAIGPDGELFFNNEPTDLEQLKEKLQSLAPPEERDSTEIYIRPGLLAPRDAIAQVEELTREFDETVEPLPGATMQIAPEGDEEEPPPKR